MIISRTPFRITLGGGGTDLPSYYERFGGLVISAAINRYVFISVNRTFTQDYFFKYSALERVERTSEIKHPIIREVFTSHSITPGIELVSVADIPAGTGLGSSGAFTVGLLRALHAYERTQVTPADIAQEACEIEIDRLGQPVGKQDQFIAAFGGLTCFEFLPDGQVQVSPLKVSNDVVWDLEEHLLMFFTGYSREAERVLSEQKTRSEKDDHEMLDNLHYVKENWVNEVERYSSRATRSPLLRLCTSIGSTRRSAHPRCRIPRLIAGIRSDLRTGRLGGSWSAPALAASFCSMPTTRIRYGRQ